jgi:hypothetical protein
LGIPQSAWWWLPITLPQPGGPKGDIPIGLLREEYTEARKTLLDHNVAIIQGTKPFAPSSRFLDWGYPTPEAIMDKTLEFFGAGTKIAIEAAVMATDSGAVKDREEVISCAGTFKGLDCALIVKTTYSMNVFSQFEVREILAKPRHRVTQLPEYTFDHWKGDLDRYY